MNRDTPDPLPNLLPEVPEAGADSAVRALYSDIREVTRLPMVNLIYRHLATRTEVLAWAWDAIRPHFLSGAIGAAAHTLRGRVAVIVDAIGPLSRSSAMPERSPAAGVLEVVRAYNMGNSLNLIAISALLDAGHVAGTTAPLPSPLPRMAEIRTEAAAAPLPPLPAPGSFDAATMARIQRLNRFADESQPAVVASLYRHLAQWPDSLADAEALLGPLQLRDLLLPARRAAVAAVAELLARQPLPMPPPIAAFEQRFAPTVRHFTTITIPKMLPIGGVLLKAWQPGLPST